MRMNFVELAAARGDRRGRRRRLLQLGDAEHRPASAAARRRSPAPSVVAAAGCTVGVSWNNYQEERWAKWDEPAIKKALRPPGQVHLERRQVVGRDPGHQHRQPDLPGRQGPDHPRPGRHGHQAGRRERPQPRHPGHRLRPPDRGSEALYITFDNVLVGKLQAEALLKVKDPRQLRRHQGQQGRRERRLPAPGHGPSRPARGGPSATSSRTSARPTPTTGIRPRPRPRWSSS